MDKRSATAIGLVIPVLGFLSMGPLSAVFPESDYGPLGIALAVLWAVPAQLVMLYCVNLWSRGALTGATRRRPEEADDPEDIEPEDLYGTGGRWDEYEKLTRQGAVPREDPDTWVPYSDAETAAREPYVDETPTRTIDLDDPRPDAGYL